MLVAVLDGRVGHLGLIAVYGRCGEVAQVGENLSEDNAQALCEQVDLIVDCAPLFEERFAMNRQAVEQRKPLIECAMFDLEASITTIFPGRTPCLACLTPEKPTEWTREFPVFGAVSGTVGCMAAMEAIKVLAGFGEPLAGTLLAFDLRDMTFSKRRVSRNPECEICRGLTS